MSAQRTPGATFAVEGRGPFPIDMLRYDSCWPASETDSALIEQSIARRSGAPATRRVHVTNGHAQLTEGRWDSFGWTIVGPT